MILVIDNPKQILNWTDLSISTWKAQGIKLQAGISIEKIFDFERQLDFKFPQDFIDLYSKVNGFEDYEWNENMFSLWSLQRIVKEYQVENDSNYIAFCDFLIHSHSIGFYKTQSGIYKWHGYPLSIANSFEQFITLLNSNDDLLY